MTIARLSNKGQITLPAAVRRKLGLAADSRVEAVVREDEIILRPVRSIAQLHGILHEHAIGREPLGPEQERSLMEEATAREVDRKLSTVGGVTRGEAIA
jgi:AbrB family looped-hinge helix DNA binding protein